MTDLPVFVVEFLAGSSRSGTSQRFSENRIRIGRRPDNDIIFDPDMDRAVSGHHVEITRTGEAVTLRDCGSQNGTFIAGERVHGERTVTLPVDMQLGSDGPCLRISLAVEPTPAKPAPSAGKLAIGEATLERAIAGVTHRERGMRRRILVIGVLLIAATALLAFIAISWQGARLDAEASARSQAQREVEAKLAAAQREAADVGDRWAELVTKYRESIFLCAAENADKGEGGIGTAWVVRSRGVLATNAHVAIMLRDMPDKAVVQNHTGRAFAIKRIAIHPDFGSPLSPDIALIEIESAGIPLTEMPLADAATLEDLSVGTELGTIGYPGELVSTYFAAREDDGRFPNALATFKTGRIGRLTNFDMQVGTWQDNVLIQHSASTTGGTSGSPMFTAKGQVVALNNAGLDQEVMVSNEQGLSSSRMANPAQIGFAIRVDLLRAFLAKPTW